jgi:hypothetical protein
VAATQLVSPGMNLPSAEIGKVLSVTVIVLSRIAPDTHRLMLLVGDSSTVKREFEKLTVRPRKLKIPIVLNLDIPNHSRPCMELQQYSLFMCWI